MEIYTVFKAIAFASLFTAFAVAPVFAQVADTPEEAKRRAELSNAPLNEKLIASAAIAYIARDARDLCGFTLTAFAERVIAGAEKFTTVEQRRIAETISLKTRPRAPLAEFCNTVREEFEHAPAKWLAE